MHRREFLTLSAHAGILTALYLGGITGCRKSESPHATLVAHKPPYPENALEPYISKETVNVHYQKHHLGYVKKTVSLLKKSPYRHLPLDELVRKSHMDPDGKALFNNAAQILNHNLYWQNLRPGGGGEPSGKIAEGIRRSFGGYTQFRKKFIADAGAHFASGWVWLVANGDELKIVSTSDAINPVVFGMTPLLALDVWEHAYYLDYRNMRGRYIEAYFDHLVNWDFANEQLPSTFADGS